MKKHILTYLIAIALWQIICSLHLANPLFLPTPLETVKEFVYLLGKKTILLDLIYSLQRILYGVVLSFIIGIPVGLILGYYENIYRYIDCLTDFFRSIPPILTFPLALLIFGVGDASRVAVIVFGCTTIMILNSALGVHNSSKMRVNVAKIMGAKWYQIFYKVILFDALPQIFIGIRVSLSMGVIIAIVTEMLVGAKYGLGSRAVNAQTAYNTPELYVTIIIVGLVGLFINKGLIVLEKRIVHWKQAD